MLIRDGNILDISGPLPLPSRIEPRWPHVYMVYPYLQRIKPENISLQKTRWKIRGFNLFSLKRFKKQHTYNVLLQFKIISVLCFPRRDMRSGRGFFLASRGHHNTHRRLFKCFKFEGLGTLGYVDIRISKWIFSWL